MGGSVSVLLLSGGLDSFVLLARECERGRRPALCLTFDYGQRHRREIDAAQAIMDWCRCPGRVHRLPPDIFTGSALTGGPDVPKGLDYRDPSQAATVVPGRNLVFLSIAVAEAARIGAGRVLFAAHAGDEAVYPDCRTAFVAAFGRAAKAGYGVLVEAPFQHIDKRGVVALGRSLNKPYGLPFELAWSCYEGGREPCGRCGACVERAEAMA